MSGSGSSKKLAKKDAALAMLQYISDGGEMLVNDDGNKESALQSSEVLITSAFFFDYVIVILAQIYTLLL